MFSENLKLEQGQESSKPENNKGSLGVEKNAQQNKLEIEIKNYNTLISSSPPATKDVIKAQLTRIADSMKEALGLPNDASISLNQKINQGKNLVTGIITIPGSPKEIKVSVGIDRDDGSIVIGKPLEDKATIAGFNLGVRLSGSSMKENFEKINTALKVLPGGFSAIGVSDKGEVIAYNGQSNCMLSLGSKNAYLDNVRIVSKDDRGRPIIKKPTELRVEQDNQEGSYPRLRIGIEGNVSFVDPFPSTLQGTNRHYLDNVISKPEGLKKIDSAKKLIDGGKNHP